jgi:hypothetical protein
MRRLACCVDLVDSVPFRNRPTQSPPIDPGARRTVRCVDPRGPESIKDAGGTGRPRPLPRRGSVRRGTGGGRSRSLVAPAACLGCHSPPEAAAKPPTDAAAAAVDSDFPAAAAADSLFRPSPCPLPPPERTKAVRRVAAPRGGSLIDFVGGGSSRASKKAPINRSWLGLIAVRGTPSTGRRRSRRGRRRRRSRRSPREGDTGGLAGPQAGGIVARVITLTRCDPPRRHEEGRPTVGRYGNHPTALTPPQT